MAEKKSGDEFEDLDAAVRRHSSDDQLEAVYDMLLGLFRGESPRDDIDDDIVLHLFIDAWAKDNGKGLRATLKDLDATKKGDGPLASKAAELAEVLIQHPAFRNLVHH